MEDFAVNDGTTLILVQANSKSAANIIGLDILGKDKDLYVNEFERIEDYRETKQTYYAVIGKKLPWDENKQVKLYNITWREAVRHCRGMSQATELEIRLSTTEGFNNQGTYIWWHR